MPGSKNDNLINKYECFWYDLALTAMLTVLAYVVGRNFSSITRSLFDSLYDVVRIVMPMMLFDLFLAIVAWGIWFAILVILIESVFVSLKHYWKWVVIVTFSTTFARFVGQHIDKPVEYYSIGDYVVDVLANGLFYVVCIIPIAGIVFVVRRKRLAKRND